VHPPTQKHGHAIAAAALKGHDDVLRILIEAGTDVNAGYCVQLAANHEKWSTVRILIKAGATVNEDLLLALEEATRAEKKAQETEAMEAMELTNKLPITRSMLQMKFEESSLKLSTRQPRSYVSVTHST
jgi:hypothetical protein